jgi:hypothetical protein
VIPMGDVGSRFETAFQVFDIIVHGVDV